MVNVKLNNYVPVEITGKEEEWKARYKKGLFFEATARSKNEQVKAVYLLNSEGETFRVLINNREVKKLSKKISQNNGTGMVRLSGGPVNSRYGSFRRDKFQEFLDKFEISTVSHVKLGTLDSAFVLEGVSKECTIIMPVYGRYTMTGKNNFSKFNGISMENRMSQRIILKPSDDKDEINICSINAPYWIVDEQYGDIKRRRLYVTEAINVMDLEPELKVLLKE